MYEASFGMQMPLRKFKAKNDQHAETMAVHAGAESCVRINKYGQTMYTVQPYIRNTDEEV